MSWSVLQAASHANASAAASVTVTFSAANLTSGSKIIAAVATSSSTNTVASVKDGAGASLTSLASGTLAGTGGFTLWAMDTTAGDAGTKPAITATMGGGTTDLAILVLEVSGLLAGNTAAMLDGTPGSAAGTSTGTLTSPAYSSAAAGEFLLAAYGDDGGPYTWTDPAGYSDTPAAGSAAGINGSGLNDIELSWKNSTGGAETAQYSLSGTAGSASWCVFLGAFQLSGSSSVSDSEASAAAESAPVTVSVADARAWQS